MQNVTYPVYEILENPAALTPLASCPCCGSLPDVYQVSYNSQQHHRAVYCSFTEALGSQGDDTLEPGCPLSRTNSDVEYPTLIEAINHWNSVAEALTEKRQQAQLSVSTENLIHRIFGSGGQTAVKAEDNTGPFRTLILVDIRGRAGWLNVDTLSTEVDHAKDHSEVKSRLPKASYYHASHIYLLGYGWVKKPLRSIPLRSFEWQERKVSVPWTLYEMKKAWPSPIAPLAYVYDHKNRLVGLVSDDSDAPPFYAGKPILPSFSIRRKRHG